MKKAVSVFLAVIMLFSVLTVGFSVSAEDEENYVARMWICSTNISSYDPFGHEFLYFENLTDETIKVGRYMLPPGEGVTVGSFGFTSPDGFGVYYNLEGCREEHEDLLAAGVELTADEFEKVSDKIADFNWWDPFLNCVFFAFIMWNQGPGRTLVPCWLPIFARWQISSIGGEEGAVSIFRQPEEHVYRQNDL